MIFILSAPLTQYIAQRQKKLRLHLRLHLHQGFQGS